MRAIKDYYKILQIKPAASQHEIKHVYRKLAMKYHPDRNPGDEISSAVFAEVAEAYTVLSDTEARRKYNEARYVTAQEEYKKPAETIETLIQRINQINKQIKISDPFRFNKDALLYSIIQLLPDDITLLLHTPDNLVKHFLESVLHAVKYLSSQQTKQLITYLQLLYAKHAWLPESLDKLLYQQQKQERWEKNKIILAVILALMLCIIIFLAASK